MTRYQNVISNNVKGLTITEIKNTVPAAFATESHSSRSARYTTVPNGEIIEALEGIDYVVTQAMQSNTQIDGGREHARHQLTFSNRRDLGLDLAAAFRIVLTDDSMGGGCFILRPGYFRAICDNGIFSGDFELIKVRHTGNIVEGVVNGVLALARVRSKLLELVEQDRHLLLPEKARSMFAEAVAKVRFGDKANNFNSRSLLQPTLMADRLAFHRREENPTSLYNTANTVQYNALHGGQHGYDRKNERRVSARGINGIVASNQINEAIAGFNTALREQFS